MHRNLWKMIAMPVLCLSLVFGGTAFTAIAADYNYTKTAVSLLYPDKASIMDAVASQKDALMARYTANGSTGNFETGTDNTEIGNADWGAVALLAFWWSNNPAASDRDAVRDAARQGLRFALDNRDWNTPPSNTSYLLNTTSTEYYATYSLSGYSASNMNTAGTPVGAAANYPTTAWSLLYKALILKIDGVAADNLFTFADKQTIKARAASNWRWLTQVSKYNPQKTPNQVMGAILGGYMLGSLYPSTDPVTGTLQNEALQYYSSTTVLAGTNLNQSSVPAQCANTSYVQGYGYFQCENVTDQDGYRLFYEQGGFETHYSGLQLSFMAALHKRMIDVGDTSAIKDQLLNDGVSQAQYINRRLSASGTMHGGTRHNEVSGSKRDNAVALGYNYFGAEIGADMGRVRLDGSTAPLSTDPSNSQLYGHGAMGFLLFYDDMRPWNNTANTLNDRMAFRKGSVSIYFDKDTNQPAEIAVNGITFTDNLINDGVGDNVKAQGFYYRDNPGNWKAGAKTPNNYTDAVGNYIVRTTTGHDNNLNADIKTRYITDGTSLYQIMLIQFNQDTVLKSTNAMIGLPYFSRTQRIMSIYDGVDTSKVFDLGSGTAGVFPASGNVNVFKIGNLTGSNAVNNVFIQGWPYIKAENKDDATTPNEVWMSSTTGSSGNKTLESLVGLSTKVFWYKKAGTTEKYIKSTDNMRVKIFESSTPQTYTAGEVICAIAKFTPQTAIGSYEAYTVSATVTNTTKQTVTGSITVSDPNMTLVIPSFNSSGVTLNGTTIH